MDKNEPNDNSDSQKETSALAKYTGIAFQMIAIIGLFAFAGYKIDEAGNHQTKWATAGLSLIGVFISLYVIIRSVKN